MLQQEHAHGAAPLLYAPLNTPNVSPQELAQAIVAVERRQPAGSQATVDPSVVEQTLAQTGLQTTPEQLLEEVRAQRTLRHQDAAMSRHKLHDTPFRLLLAGGITATVAAMFLLFSNYFFLQKLQATSEMLAVSQEREARVVASADAQQVLQKWVYPHATKFGTGTGSHIGMLTLTTNDSYAAVWKYYADQLGGETLLKGMRVNAEGIIPDLNATGVGTSTYRIHSSGAPYKPMLLFNSLTPQATVSGIITYDAATHKTNIELTSTTRVGTP